MKMGRGWMTTLNTRLLWLLLLSQWYVRSVAVFYEKSRRRALAMLKFNQENVPFVIMFVPVRFKWLSLLLATSLMSCVTCSTRYEFLFNSQEGLGHFCEWHPTISSCARNRVRRGEMECVTCDAIHWHEKAANNLVLSFAWALSFPFIHLHCHRYIHCPVDEHQRAH